MSRRILVVCAQNVCRSPYLAATIGAGLDRIGTGHDVVSRGVRADLGDPMCDVALASLPPEAAARGEAHRSRLLKRGDVERAALILTATTRERAAVALLDPSARPRTFTVREFVLLSAIDDGRIADRPGDLSALGSALHGRRALLATRPEHRGIVRRRSVTPVLDIPDAHRESAARHRALFPSMLSDTRAVLEALAAPCG